MLVEATRISKVGSYEINPISGRKFVNLPFFKKTQKQINVCQDFLFL